MPKTCQVRYAHIAIDERSTFIAGGMSARTSASAYDTGRLPAEWAEIFRADVKGGIRYVVLSYATPIGWIAWHNGDMVYVIPDVTYSRTTTIHQNKVRAGFEGQDIVSALSVSV